MSTINTTLHSLHTLLACILSLSMLVSVVAHADEHTLALDDSTYNYIVVDIDFCDDLDCVNIAVNPSVSTGTYTNASCVYPGHIFYNSALIPKPRAPPRIS